MNQTFYMVFMDGGITPTYRHATLDGAEQEAKRLSSLNKKKTWVLCTLKSIELQEFTIKDCRPDKDSDLPF